MASHSELGLHGRKQGLHIGFDIKEINVLVLGTPLRGMAWPEAQPRYTHRLAESGHTGVAVLNRRIFGENTPQLKDVDTLCASVKVEFQNVNQAPQQARTHHVHVASNGV